MISLKDVKKRRIITAFAIMLAVGIISLAALKYIDYASSAERKKKDENKIPATEYIFYKADYKENIFEDEAYMELNRDIAYTEGATTVLITDGNYSIYGPWVKFFAEYIDSVINGDAKKYNSFFCEEYFAQTAPKEQFTMQKLYDIKLTYNGTDKIKIGGNEYLSYEVLLDYAIMKNNGTFRNDMGSDSIRPQAITLIEKNNELKIYSINTYTVIAN